LDLFDHFKIALSMLLEINTKHILQRRYFAGETVGKSFARPTISEAFDIPVNSFI